MHVSSLSCWMWTSAIWSKCEIKCLCCSPAVKVSTQDERASLRYCKYWIGICHFIYWLPSSGCYWLFSSETKTRLFVLCNIILNIIDAERWKSNCAASTCSMYLCLNRSVFYGGCWVSALTVRETSSGLSNHGAAVGLKVVIILKHSKYNVQDARVFVGHSSNYI